MRADVYTGAPPCRLAEPLFPLSGRDTARLAADMLAAGLRATPAKAIQERAGQQDVTTTQRYMRLSPAHKDAASDSPDEGIGPAQQHVPIRITRFKLPVEHCAQTSSARWTGPRWICPPAIAPGRPRGHGRGLLPRAQLGGEP